MLGGNRAVLVSTASTIVFFVVLGLILYMSPGFAAFRASFLNWDNMKESFHGTLATPSIWHAFVLNVRMFLIAEPLILIFALAIAVVRQFPGPVFFPFRLVAIAYTDFFRGVPLILVIYVMGFAVPGLLIHGVSFYESPVVYGVIALVLSYSAYVAEVYRAGIESVHPSQMAAARSLGLSRMRSLRHVVIPQAVRRVIPPLLNDFISLQKDAALVAILGPLEAFRVGQIAASSNFEYTPLVGVALLYVCVTIPLARYVDRIQRRRRT